MADAETKPRSELGDQVRSLVERTINRGIKGVEYIASPLPQIGVTPKDLLLERGTLRFYHYRPLAEEVYRVPILLVMATTNRGSIFDLAPGHSLVEFLLRQGYDIYMMDWEAPRQHEKGLTIGSYVRDFIPHCLELMAMDSGEPDATMIGYCFGGVLSLIYNALHLDGPVRNLVTFTTPTDFSKMELFHNWANRAHFDVDRLVDTLGNVPGDMLMGSFEMLKPVSRSAGQARLWDNMWNDPFVQSFRKIDRWANDMLPLAGEYFRETTRKLMWENGLMTGELEIDGQRADISQICVPFLHVIAEHDHIVPYDASHPLIDRIGSTDKQEIVLKGGHVSLVAGPNAVKRLWPQLDIWLQERSL
ncbi:MAG: alpha/beta fold hydrolase [Sphingomonadales bacterium]|nr:alpha/beta fold hydrolase [Sphingomonadales bacterium]MDE2569683.1 alpha/beta fold hydrolase [Sphingomonadales bacterium]